MGRGLWTLVHRPLVSGEAQRVCGPQRLPLLQCWAGLFYFLRSKNKTKGKPSKRLARVTRERNKDEAVKQQGDDNRVLF